TRTLTERIGAGDHAQRLLQGLRRAHAARLVRLGQVCDPVGQVFVELFRFLVEPRVDRLQLRNQRVVGRQGLLRDGLLGRVPSRLSLGHLRTNAVEFLLELGRVLGPTFSARVLDLLVQLVHPAVELVELLFLAVALVAFERLEAFFKLLDTPLGLPALGLGLAQDVQRDGRLSVFSLFFLFFFFFLLFLFLLFFFLGDLLLGRALGSFFGVLFFFFLFLLSQLVAAINELVGPVIVARVVVRISVLAYRHYGFLFVAAF